MSCFSLEPAVRGERDRLPLVVVDPRLERVVTAVARPPREPREQRAAGAAVAQRGLDEDAQDRVRPRRVLVDGAGADESVAVPREQELVRDLRVELHHLGGRIRAQRQQAVVLLGCELDVGEVARRTELHVAAGYAAIESWQRRCYERR